MTSTLNCTIKILKNVMKFTKLYSSKTNMTNSATSKFTFNEEKYYNNYVFGILCPAELRGFEVRNKPVVRNNVSLAEIFPDVTISDRLRIAASSEVKIYGIGRVTLPKFILPSFDHEYVQPRKAVHNEAMMIEWENTEAYHEYFGFIKAMNIAVRGKSLPYECHISPVTTGILNLLKTLDDIVSEIPPIDQPQRFGNKAFKIWYERVKKEADTLLKANLPEEFHKAITEISDYLIEGFGNSTRIDYGTGHEMSFCMFLCCLFKIGAFKEEDSVAVVNKVFNSYLELVRRLQTTYRMEPAGSHGVWSLDDYQFVPFIWGSSQFVGKPIVEPKMFVQENVINKYASEYMFMGCLNYITTVKSGHFSEHSNQLWNISGLSTWTKINEGLIKMYQGEVLNKFPVVQHVLFGSLIRFIPLNKTLPPPCESTKDFNFEKPVAGDG